MTRLSRSALRDLRAAELADAAEAVADLERRAATGLVYARRSPATLERDGWHEQTLTGELRIPWLGDLEPLPPEPVYVGREPLPAPRVDAREVFDFLGAGTTLVGLYMLVVRASVMVRLLDSISGGVLATFGQKRGNPRNPTGSAVARSRPSAAPPADDSALDHVRDGLEPAGRGSIDPNASNDQAPAQVSTGRGGKPGEKL